MDKIPAIVVHTQDGRMAYGSPRHRLRYEQSCFLEKRQLRAVANGDLTSVAHVPGKHSFSQMSFNETSIGQQMESSEQYVGENFPKGSDLNNNTGLKPGPVSFSTSPIAFEGHSCGISAQPFSVPDMSYTSSPLLLDLLEGNLFSLEFSSSTMSLLEKTSTNVETPMKSSPLSVNARQKMAQNPGYSGVTDQSSQMFPFAPSSLPFIKEILASGEPRPFTDEEINCVIKKILAYFKSVLTKDINNGLQVHSLQTSNSIAATTPTKSLQEDVEWTNLSCAAIEQCTSAARGAIKGNNQKDSKASSKVKGHKGT